MKVLTTEEIHTLNLDKNVSTLNSQTCGSATLVGNNANRRLNDLAGPLRTNKPWWVFWDFCLVDITCHDKRHGFNRLTFIVWILLNTVRTWLGTDGRAGGLDLTVVHFNKHPSLSQLRLGDGCRWAHFNYNTRHDNTSGSLKKWSRKYWKKNKTKPTNTLKELQTSALKVPHLSLNKIHGEIWVTKPLNS